MKTKIYLNDWVLNAGIIGFIKIMRHSGKKDLVITHTNYIEIDTNDLRDFHHYYFKYFFDIYDVSKKIDERMKNDFTDFRTFLQIEDPDEKSKQKFKRKKDYLKQMLKSNLDKVKKIDKNLYEQLNISYKEIDNIKTKDDLEKIDEIYNNIKSGFSLENINNIITMNSFKNYLSSKYFGQQSFFNVVKTSLTFEEQKKLMYKDYVSDIIEAGFLHDILNNKYNIEEIKEYIQKVDTETLSDKINSIYNKIMKNYIYKNKTLEEIQEFLNKNIFITCSMCEEHSFLSSNYTESNFLPLALSSENAQNFFWNMNVGFPICDMCKLILFCTPAGINNIIKIEKDINDYKEKNILCFVNYDTSIDKLYITNENLLDNSKKDKTHYNPYSDLILDIVKQEKNLSIWQLQNIFVVELDSEYRGYSRIEYFNIQKYVAIFLSKYKIIDKITDYKYKLQIMDYILKNKDFSLIITNRLIEELKKDDPKRFTFNSFMAIKSRLILNILKKEEKEEMQNNEIDKGSKKINVLYNIGIDIHESLKRTGEDNKLDGYVYQLLNNIKVNNKENFMDIVIRIHMLMNKEVSPIFLECMKDDATLDFATIGHSFVAGLISTKYEKNNSEENSEENQD